MAIGDLAASLKDTQTQQVGNQGFSPQLLGITGTNVFIFVYEGGGSDGWIETWTIDTAGNIDASAIDTYEFDPGTGLGPSIIHISGTVYAIAYGGAGGVGNVITINISDAGVITNSSIDTLEFESGSCLTRQFNFLRIGNTNNYAFAYQGGSDIKIVTFTISEAGAIGAAIIDSLVITVGRNLALDFKHIRYGVYATVNDQLVKSVKVNTFKITDAGAISSVIATKTLDTSGTTLKPALNWVFGDIYVVVYKDSSATNTIETLSITSAGEIGSVIDTVVDLIPGNIYDVELLTRDSSTQYFLVAYKDGNFDYIAAFSVDNNGTISTSLIDSLQVTVTGVAYYISLLEAHVNSYTDSVWALAYQGPSTGQVGTISTLVVESAEPVSQPNVDVSPSDPLVRVTALVIHWSAGPNAVYQEEVLTGGLFSQYFSPISPIKEPEATLPELVQNRQPARDILSKMVPTLREYGQWLKAHSQAEQRAILSGIPGADILTLRVWQEWVVRRRSMGKDI